MNIGLGIGCAAAAIAFLLFYRAKRKLAKLHIQLNETFQEVDAFMESRVAVHVKWAETVAAYDLEAQGILADTTVIQDRFRDMPVEEKTRLCKKLDELADRMMASAKKCPRLRTSGKYIQLHSQAEELRMNMPDACCAYNTHAEQINKEIGRFPANIAALITGFEQKELFHHPEKKSAAV